MKRSFTEKIGDLFAWYGHDITTPIKWIAGILFLYEMTMYSGINAIMALEMVAWVVMVFVIIVIVVFGGLK